MARPKTPTEIYLVKIQKSIDFIERHLNKDGKELLQVKIGSGTGMSGRRVRDLFNVYNPEKLQVLLTRLKLEKAKRLMLYTELASMDIASESGFGDMSTLRKLIRAKYMMSISDYRKKMRNEIIDEGRKVRAVGTHDLSASKVLAFRTSGDYNGRQPEMAWKGLMKIVEEHQIDLTDARYYGLLYDEVSIMDPDFCRYDACLMLKKPLPDKKQMRLIDFPTGAYLVFEHTDPYSALEQTYSDIFYSWDKRLICDLGKRPMIEHYLGNPQTTAVDEMITEILIPIRKENETSL